MLNSTKKRQTQNTSIGNWSCGDDCHEDTKNGEGREAGGGLSFTQGGLPQNASLIMRLLSRNLNKGGRNSGNLGRLSQAEEPGEQALRRETAWCIDRTTGRLRRGAEAKPGRRKMARGQVRAGTERGTLQGLAAHRKDCAF